MKLERRSNRYLKNIIVTQTSHVQNLMQYKQTLNYHMNKLNNNLR